MSAQCLVPSLGTMLSIGCPHGNRIGKRRLVEENCIRRIEPGQRKEHSKVTGLIYIAKKIASLVATNAVKGKLGQCLCSGLC